MIALMIALSLFSFVAGKGSKVDHQTVVIEKANGEVEVRESKDPVNKVYYFEYKKKGTE